MPSFVLFLDLFSEHNSFARFDFNEHNDFV